MCLAYIAIVKVQKYNISCKAQKLEVANKCLMVINLNVRHPTY